MRGRLPTHRRERGQTAWFFDLLRGTRGVAPAVLMLGASVALTIGMAVYVTAKLQGDAVVQSVTQEAKILKRIHINEAARLYARQSIRSVVNQAIADVLQYGGFTDPTFADLGAMTTAQGKLVVMERCKAESGPVTWRKECEQELDPFIEGDVSTITERAHESINQLIPERISTAVTAHNREDMDAMIILTSAENHITFTEDGITVLVPLNITTYLANKMGVVSSPEFVSETVHVRMVKLFEVGLQAAREDIHGAARDALCGVCDHYPNDRPAAKDLRERIDGALDELAKELSGRFKDEGISVTINQLEETDLYILPTSFDRAGTEGIEVVDWEAPAKEGDPVPQDDYANGQVAQDETSGKRAGRYGLGADLVLHVRAEDRRTYLPYRVRSGSATEYEYRPLAVEFILQRRVWESDDDECSRKAACEG